MGPWEAVSLRAFICRISRALFSSSLRTVNGTDDERGGFIFSPSPLPLLVLFYYAGRTAKLLVFVSGFQLVT